MIMRGRHTGTSLKLGSALGLGCHPSGRWVRRGNKRWIWGKKGTNLSLSGWENQVRLEGVFFQQRQDKHILAT